MARSVVLVHDDPEFVLKAVLALVLSGHSAVVYGDPVAALDALDDPHTAADLLITWTQFQAGKSNGIAVARMMRLQRPDMKLLIMGREDLADLPDEVAEFLPLPVDMDTLVATARRLLMEQEGPGCGHAAKREERP
jgi:DNA-binding NtrC family response regulator